VRRIEARCQTRAVHIPLLGVANFFIKVARPSGVSDMKLAILEDVRRPLSAEEREFTTLAGDAPGPGWRPLRRVQERGAWTSIYAAGSGKHWKLVIATLEPRDATVIRLRLNPVAMRRWIMNPYAEERNRHRRD